MRRSRRRPPQARELNLSNRGDLVLLQGVEDDGVVYAVQELGAEALLKQSEDRILNAVVIGSAPARL